MAFDVSTRTFQKNKDSGAPNWGCCELISCEWLNGIQIGCYSIPDFDGETELTEEEKTHLYFAMCEHGSKSNGVSSKNEVLSLASKSTNFCVKCLEIAEKEKRSHEPVLVKLRVLNDRIYAARKLHFINGIKQSLVGNHDALRNVFNNHWRQEFEPILERHMDDVREALESQEEEVQSSFWKAYRGRKKEVPLNSESQLSDSRSIGPSNDTISSTIGRSSLSPSHLSDRICPACQISVPKEPRECPICDYAEDGPHFREGKNTVEGEGDMTTDELVLERKHFRATRDYE